MIANYGPNWFQKRESEGGKDATQEKEVSLTKSVESLKQTGFCLDNLISGNSGIEHAGRGAFAARTLPKGSVVAPVPVLPITKRDAMDVTRLRQISQDIRIPSTTQQLLLNYCYGHPKSSILLFPYSPIVNLINHNSKRPNARLQWSSFNKQHDILSLGDLRSINTEKDSSSGELLLELVATEDISEGDEVVVDYGQTWETAWSKHVAEWEPSENKYAPAYIMDEAVPMLATQEELQSENVYPQNVITSCFYRFDINDPAWVKQMEKLQSFPAAKNITRSPWTLSPGIFELENLRPCTVMQRFEVENPKNNDKEGDGNEEQEQEYYYTVVIRNRYGLKTQERIPVGHMHVVTHVPRQAIRFTDKIYTTDQHLPNAFRHEIGLGDDVFPSQWMDLA